jgi:hypothetical protein
MNSWLIVAHISDTFEINDFKKIFKKVQKQLSETTDIYVIYVYHKKRGKIIHITNESYEILKYFNQKDDTQTVWCNKMLNFVLKLTKPVAMTYYGHGGGLVVGPWVNPWMSLKKFNNIFIKKVKPEILCFDSCYLGSIVSLYEIEHNVKFVLASPAWHPYTSISSLKLFGNLPNYTKQNKTEIFKKYAIDMSCEFSTVKGQPKYSCLVAFDLTNLDKIIKKIKKLEFIEEHNLKLHDPDHYDLLATVEANISKELSTIVLSKKCMSKCPITIQGPSVSYQFKDGKWGDYFSNSKWGKFTKTINITHTPKDETL